MKKFGYIIYKTTDPIDIFYHTILKKNYTNIGIFIDDTIYIFNKFIGFINITFTQLLKQHYIENIDKYVCIENKYDEFIKILDNYKNKFKVYDSKKIINILVGNINKTSSYNIKKLFDNIDININNKDSFINEKLSKSTFKYLETYTNDNLYITKNYLMLIIEEFISYYTSNINNFNKFIELLNLDKLKYNDILINIFDILKKDNIDISTLNSLYKKFNDCDDDVFVESIKIFSNNNNLYETYNNNINKFRIFLNKIIENINNKDNIVIDINYIIDIYNNIDNNNNKINKILDNSSYNCIIITTNTIDKNIKIIKPNNDKIIIPCYNANLSNYTKEELMIILHYLDRINDNNNDIINLMNDITKLL